MMRFKPATSLDVSLSVLLLLLVVLPLRHVAAVPSDPQIRQDVNIQSVELKFKPNCTRTTEIERAWDDAIKLLTSLEKVDFDNWVAWDFFGPSAVNERYQSNIQAVLDNAKTFGQGWKIMPTPFKVKVNIDCGLNPQIELDTRCRRSMGAANAYTWNTEYSNGTGNQNFQDPRATMNMYICNSFFDYQDLDDRINQWKDEAIDNIKYRLDTYYNRAYIILHEMMHANRITYAANGHRHMFNTQMRLKFGITEPSWIPVYGALNTKILARTSEENTAAYVSQNADNYAHYVLAKYVQGKTGSYPWLPLAYDVAKGRPRYIANQIQYTTKGSD